MKSNLKKYLAVLLALAMVLGMTACGAAEAEPETTAAPAVEATAAPAEDTSGPEPVTIRITWWGGQARHDYTQEVLDLYTSLNPHVTFEAVPSGWDGYFEKLATDTATGGMPDLVQMDYMYIATYADNGALADMTPYINDGTLDLSNVDDALLSSGQIGGKSVGIPLSTSLIAYTYNPDVLAEAGVEVPQDGWTWEDYRQMALTIVEKTGKYAFAGSPVEDTNAFNYWVRQYGVSLFAEDKKSLGYEDDAITEAYFQYWLDLMEAGAIPNPDEYEQIATLGKEGSPVITGGAAFRQDWNNFTTIGAAAGNEDLKLVTPPTKDGAAALWYKPGMFFSVAETSAVKEECAKFISWFINSEEANDIIMGERGTPASSAIREYLIDSGKMTPQQGDMFNYATTAAPFCSAAPNPDPAGISEINTVFKDIAYSVFYGQSTPAEAAAEFRAQANDILAANN